MPSVVTSSMSRHRLTAPRRSAGPRRAPSCGTPPRRRRADRLADEAVEVERPCRYRSISIGKSRDGRQSPYHDDFSAPPRPKTSMNGSSNVMSGGHADQHDGAGEVAGVERLLVHLRVADGLDAHVGAVAVGDRLDVLDRIGGRRVDGVRGAEVLGPLELAVVEVDGDDRRRAGQRALRRSRRRRRRRSRTPRPSRRGRRRRC